MKREVSPAIVAVIIVLVLGIAFFAIMKGTGSPGNKGPGEVGNPSPFSPGGAAVGKGGGKSAQPGAAGNPSPFSPRPSNQPSGHS